MTRSLPTAKLGVMVAFLTTTILYLFVQRQDFVLFAKSNIVANKTEVVATPNRITDDRSVTKTHPPTVDSHPTMTQIPKPVINPDRYKLPGMVKSWFPDSHTVPLTVNKDFLVTPTNLCPLDTPLDYLVMVHTAVGNTDRRQGIRDTYGQVLFKQPVGRVVFLLGTTENQTLTQIVRKEAATYNDVVVGDFHDSYHNLTLKGVAGLKWTNEFCPGVKMVIKVDDDVFVNIFKLVRFMAPPFINKTRQLKCLFHPAWTKAVMRDGSKWNVDKSEFKGVQHFPIDHCDGFFVMISGDLIQPLLEAASVVPFFWIDDVYLFGLLPYTIGDVDIVSCLDHLTFSTGDASTCMDKFGIYCTYYAVSQNYFSIKHFHHMWTRQKKQVTEGVKNWFHMVDDFPVNTNMDDVIKVNMPGFNS